MTVTSHMWLNIFNLASQSHKPNVKCLVASTGPVDTASDSADIEHSHNCGKFYWTELHERIALKSKLPKFT